MPDKPRKLTAEAVREIRRSTASRSELATRFGVSKRTIESICLGHSWKHIKPRRSVNWRTQICSDPSCGKKFKTGMIGAPRKLCDDCKAAHQRARKLGIGIVAFERQLVPLVEKIVREVLVEVGILKTEAAHKARGRGLMNS